MFKKISSLFISFLIIFEIFFIKPNSFTSKKLQPTSAQAVDELANFDPTAGLDESVPSEPSSYENIILTNQEVIITIGTSNDFSINNNGTTTTHNLLTKGVNFTSEQNSTSKVKIKGNTNIDTTPIQIKLNGIDIIRQSAQAMESAIKLEDNANVVFRVEGENNFREEVDTYNYPYIEISIGNRATITSSSSGSLHMIRDFQRFSSSAMIGGVSQKSAGIINICGNVNITTLFNDSTDYVLYELKAPLIGGGANCDDQPGGTINIGGNSNINAVIDNSTYNASINAAVIGSGYRSLLGVINIGENATVNASARKHSGVILGSIIGEMSKKAYSPSATKTGDINIGGNSTVIANKSIINTPESTNQAISYSPVIGSGGELPIVINIGGNTNIDASINLICLAYTSMSENNNAIIGGIFIESINIGGNANVTVTFGPNNDPALPSDYAELSNNLRFVNRGAGIGATRQIDNDDRQQFINIGGNSNVTVNLHSQYHKDGDVGAIGSCRTSVNIFGNCTVKTSVIADNINYIPAILAAASRYVDIRDNAVVIAETSANTNYTATIGGAGTSASGSIHIDGNAIVIANNTNNNASIVTNYKIPTIGCCYYYSTSISITGGFIAIKNTNNVYDIGNANSLTITGGSIFSPNSKVLETNFDPQGNIRYSKDANGNNVFPCYCQKTIDASNLLNKKILVPLEGDVSYQAPAFSSKIQEILQDNNLSDMFPSDTLSACIWLPEKNFHDQIRVSGIPNKIFKSNVAQNMDSYTTNPGPDNWLELSSSSITPPVIDTTIPVPTFDPPPIWFNIKNPTITGTGIPGYVIMIKEGANVINGGIVDEDGKWRVTLDDYPDSQRTITAVQVEEFCRRSSNGIAELINIDTTKPVGTITAGSNVFEGFLNTITFGLLFKDRVHVVVSAEDNLSGVSGIEYAVTYSMLETESEVLDLEFKNDKTMSDNSITLDFDPGNGYGEEEFDKSFFVYAKIIDTAGNKFYLNSDSITIYIDTDKVEPETPEGGDGGGSSTDGNGGGSSTGGNGSGSGTGTGGSGNSGGNGGSGKNGNGSNTSNSGNNNTNEVKETPKKAEVKEIGENDVRYKKIEEKLKKEEKKFKNGIESLKVYEVSGKPKDYFEILLGENFGKYKTYLIVYTLDKFPFDGEVIEGNPWMIRGKCVKNESIYAVMEVLVD